MKCIVCNSIIDEKHPVMDSDLYYRCKTCGLVQQNLLNMTTRKYNDFAYKVGFYRESSIRKRAQEILHELLMINKNIKSLIDIGCGAGFMLDEFKRKIDITVGVEPSKKLANYAARNFNLKIVNEYFSVTTLKKLNRKFDAVILSHIIEHLENPIEFLTSVKSLLNKNGIIYLETPNILSWLAKIEGKNYTFLTPEDHICLYSKKALNNLFRIKDINIKPINSYTYSDLEHTVGIASKLKKRVFLKKNVNKQKEIKLVNIYVSNKYMLVRNKLLTVLVKFLFMPLVNFGERGSYLVYYLKLAV